jgi:tRNA-specific 2-thiouridylase
MRVLLAMSGGVDSSAAAVVLRDAGHDVVGVTMRLWGGESDTGCCSVSDVDDARRVAQQAGIDHLVFNFSGDFEERVVNPYVDAHVNGVTPNPCIECNRHLKFDRLIRRGRELGFDAVATGHHARIEERGGQLRVVRGADTAKDQSYVVHMLSGEDLGYVLFPVGGMQKSEVRSLAARSGLRTASKPDSQDVCFIGSTVGRGGFLSSRMEFHPAAVVDTDGAEVGSVDAVELVTLGQRRGLGLGGGDKRYVVDVSISERRVTVGGEDDLLSPGLTVGMLAWPHATDARKVDGADVLVQGSAHGARTGARVRTDGTTARLTWERPQRRISPGQTVVFYDPTDTHVLGGGVVTDPD